MKIIVTGGLGLIGHNVTRKLVDKGHEVFIIDNSTNYGIVPVSEITYLLQKRSEKVAGVFVYDVAGTPEL